MKPAETCSVKDCAGPSAFLPVLGLRSSTTDHEIMAKIPNRPVCNLHRELLTTKDFLSDEGWVKIVRHMKEAGKPAPSKNLVRLAWEEITKGASTLIHNPIVTATNPGTFNPATQGFAPPDLNRQVKSTPGGLPKEARGDTAVGNPDPSAGVLVSAPSGALTSASGESWTWKNGTPIDTGVLATLAPPPPIDAFPHEAQWSRMPDVIAIPTPTFADVNASTARPETGLPAEVMIK